MDFCDLARRSGALTIVLYSTSYMRSDDVRQKYFLVSVKDCTRETLTYSQGAFSGGLSVLSIVISNVKED